ncbi:Pycsar system effector family protein [uncultured Kocuria sp.]|uniref:Pycsar system effector family protein n=1 Tax=uncultured Kocuria sp. TaxID=259305 RepID=UPI002638AB98|nr:Pycsar system effector family protein [uncultured Kocuria sp.]
MTTPAEHAWQIHSAQMDWTGKVDAKASFALALDSAAIAALVALSAENMIFADVMDSWARIPYWVSVGLFAVAGGCALWAVAPSLRWWALNDEWDDNYIYFGHVRHWHAENLSMVLGSGDITPVLSRQIIQMSRIAWKKHLKVGFSLWLAGAGVLSLIVAAIAAGMEIDKRTTPQQAAQAVCFSEQASTRPQEAALCVPRSL